MTPTLSLRGAEGDEAISRRGMVLLHSHLPSLGGQVAGDVRKEARDDKEERNARFIFAGFDTGANGVLSGVIGS